MEQRVTVWYDAQCPLCVREIALMRRLDRRSAIDFVDVHGGGVCPLDRESLLARLHARDTDGALVSGAAAFAAMWRAIPLLRPLGLVARWQPALWLLETAYRGFLRVRPAVQRLAIRLGLEGGERPQQRGSDQHQGQGPVQ
ncbi:MAG: DUF393 domain-containing protein [Pseudomonadota bacterium]